MRVSVFALLVSMLIASIVEARVRVRVNPAVRFTPTSYVFPAQSIGVPSNPATFTVQNIGAVSVPITAGITGTNAADFSISGNTCGVSIAAGASCQISLVFTPSTSSAESATLTLTAGGTGHLYTMALSGGGSLSLILSPSSIDVLDHQTLGITLSTATVAWSDGSPFTGSLTVAVDPANLCQISGNNVILKRTVSPSDDGTFTCTIRAQ